MGVTFFSSMRSPLLRSGNIIRLATKIVCRRMEIPSARRRILRARCCCVKSPSTRQLFREPNSDAQTPVGSRYITHLQEKFPARCREFSRRQPPVVAYGRPAPRSQGCEVRASSVRLDTGEVSEFPGFTDKKSKEPIWQPEFSGTERKKYIGVRSCCIL